MTKTLAIAAALLMGSVLAGCARTATDNVSVVNTQGAGDLDGNELSDNATDRNATDAAGPANSL